MRFQKHHLCHLPFCYAVGAIVKNAYFTVTREDLP